MAVRVGQFVTDLSRTAPGRRVLVSPFVCHHINVLGRYSFETGTDSYRLASTRVQAERTAG